MKYKQSFISVALATIMVVSLVAVCTSVSATNNESPQMTTQISSAKAPVASGTPSSVVGNSIPSIPTNKTQPSLVGAPIAVDNTSNSKTAATAMPDLVGSPIADGTSPSACVLNGTTNTYVFVKGYDGACWYRILSESGLWQGNWVSLGGQLTSSPAATSTSLGVVPDMTVYVRGTNGAVYAREYYNGEWFPNWFQLGGQVLAGTGPGAASTQDRIDLFVTGTNGAMYNRTFIPGSGWSPSWQNRGGQLTSSPSAVHRSYYIDVYVRGTNGQVYGDEYSLSTNTWGWYSLGGQVAAGSGPAVCVYGHFGTDRLDVFVKGTNGALYNRTWTPMSSWSPSWINQGGVLSTSPTAATYTYNGQIDIEVFVRGTNGLLYQKEFFMGTWHNWLPGVQGPP